MLLEGYRPVREALCAGFRRVVAKWIGYDCHADDIGRKGREAIGKGLPLGAVKKRVTSHCVKVGQGVNPLPQDTSDTVRQIQNMLASRITGGILQRSIGRR